MFSHLKAYERTMLLFPFFPLTRLFWVDFLPENNLLYFLKKTWKRKDGCFEKERQTCNAQNGFTSKVKSRPFCEEKLTF